jgi:hypothetical protein
MSNRDLIVLQGVARNILLDYLAVYPSDAKEVEFDLLRLSHLCQSRGLGVFLLDLPALGKHFDACLAHASYTKSALPLGGSRWPGSALPRLFSGLLVRVFDRLSGSLLSDVDPFVILTLRQIYQFAKGFEYECSISRTADAVREFYTVESEVRAPTLNWDGDRIDTSQSRSIHLGDTVCCEDHAGDPGLHNPEPLALAELRGIADTFQRVCDIVTTSFGEFVEAEWPSRHGPGAVADLRGGESKYSFPHWSAKLEEVFPFADNAFRSYSEWADSASSHSDLEPSSKLLTVPKTAKGPRLIASEPVAHQWCQQKILRYLVSGIKNGGHLGNSISLSDQNPSRDLVLEASRTRSHATIDLSAASDRVSCWLVERVFRANPSLIRAFHSSRSRWIDNGTKVRVNSPRRFPLRKFTTMGSACTFPVQSIIFALIGISTVLFEEGTDVSSASIKAVGRRVRVFGDDIIIPSEHYWRMTSNLERFGLKVNNSKSFVEGNFRESCGMDAWNGFDVTPARMNAVANSARPTSVMSAIDASNNFFLKGFWRTAAYIESTLPHWVRKNLPVVAADCGFPGLRSYCGLDLSSHRERWNIELQRSEYRVVRPRGQASRVLSSGEHSLFQYFSERRLEDESPPIDSLFSTYQWEAGRVVSSSAYLALGWEPLAHLDSRV